MQLIWSIQNPKTNGATEQTPEWLKAKQIYPNSPVMMAIFVPNQKQKHMI